VTDWLADPAVSTNADGTYSIPDGPNFPNWGVWTIRDTGHGWEATHPNDGFDGALWATANDAAGAVLGDPAKMRRWGQ
jgi:hypothetical protein